jgi:antirestriction protein ArdC
MSYVEQVIKATGGHAAPAENLEEKIPEGYHRMPDGTIMKDSEHEDEAALEKNPGDPCWEGYIQVGMKEKAGKMVPNCVPQDAAEIDVDDVLFALRKTKTIEEITPYLVTYAINETKDFDAPRAVTNEQIKTVLASAENPADAAALVLAFVELAHHDDVYENALDFAYLLPVGHPRAKVGGLTASVKREAKADWYSADRRLSETARGALYDLFSNDFGTVESRFAQMKLDALTAAGEFDTLVAVGWKISFAKRSAMSKALAKIRRRDRNGRFAEEFGRLKGFFSGGPDGKNFTGVGRIVGATKGKNEFQVEFKNHPIIPDGIYRLPADKSENVGAYLPQRIVSKLPKREAQFDPKDNDSTVPLDEFLATRMDAPDGWKAIKNEQGKITGYQSEDGSKILSVSKPDAKKADEIANDSKIPAFGVGESEEIDPNEPIYTLKDEDGNVIAYGQDWATAQKAAIYLGLGEDDKESSEPEGDKEEKQLDLGEQYGLDNAGTKKWLAKNSGGDSYEVNELPDGTYLVETTYDDGNKDEQKFDSADDAFKYVAGEVGLDPELDPKVETPEEKPAANGDGVPYGKYSPEDVADGYQFGRPMDGIWYYDDASDDEGNPLQIQVSKQKNGDTWYVEAEDRNGRTVSSNEFETPEDAFEYASWSAQTEWDQDWVDSNVEERQLELAEKYGLDPATKDTFLAEGGPGNKYEVYKTPNDEWVVETTFDDGNESSETFDNIEDAFKAVADDMGNLPEESTADKPEADAPNGDPEPGEFEAKELAAGYAFSGIDDSVGYISIRTTEDGNEIQVQKASNGKWYVTELGGNGPDNYKDIEHGEHDNPEAAFEEASNLVGGSEFDRSAAEAEVEALSKSKPVGPSLVKKNSDEDGVPINDMFDVDNAIDEHKELYFPTRASDIESELNYQINRSGDSSASTGDYMSGGAQARVSENEDGTWGATIRFPEGDDVSESFDNQEDAVRFAAEEAAIWNTNNIPAALATTKDFSDLDRELEAIETPDQALTYAARLVEIADALEESRGPKKEIQSLRDLHDLIVEEYGNGDDSQETRFFRMMAEEAPVSSSISPNTDVNSVDAPEAPGSTDEKKSVSSNQEAVNKVMSGMLAAIESGEAMPWRQPFTDDPSLAGASVPRNPVTKHVYSGVNSMVLRWVAGEKGYNDGRWMTYKNAQDLGGNVRKGEKGTFILAPRMIPKKDKDGKEVLGADGKPQKFVVFNAMAVFNVEQIDGLNLPDEKKNEDLVAKTPLEAQEFVIERYKKSMEALGQKVPDIHYTYVGQYGSHSSSPNWSPMMDNITLPTLEQFNSPEEIFDTLMHELAHSTGHASRLDRTDLTKDYGNPDGVARAKEELIAEISSAILGQMFGIENTLDNSAAYVQSWLKRLQNNPQEVISATKEAQKVVDYMLGIHLGDWSPVDGYKISKGGSN